MRIHLLSPYAPEECATRLQSVMDSDRFAPLSPAAWCGTRPVVGRATLSSLRLRKRIGYRNSFQSILSARMRRVPEGTSITCKAGVDGVVQAFTAFLFACVIILGGTMSLVTAASFAAGNRVDTGWMALVIPPGMLLFGYALVRFGRRLSRDETTFLTEFLIDVLDARVISNDVVVRAPSPLDERARTTAWPPINWP